MRRSFAVATALWLSLCPAIAGSLVVAPTTLKLSQSGEVGMLYVTNAGDKPADAQIEAFNWSQVGGLDKLSLASDLVVSPPMAHIPPGATQVVRFKPMAGAAGGAERAWRLVVSEIPDSDAQTQLGVNVLLQFSVPVFVGNKAFPEASAAKTSTPLVWDAALTRDGLMLSASNDGPAHIRITEVAFSGPHAPAATKGLFYILPGATRVWRLSPGAVAVGDHMHVEGREMAQPASAADIVVHG